MITIWRDVCNQKVLFYYLSFLIMHSLHKVNTCSGHIHLSRCFISRTENGFWTGRLEGGGVLCYKLLGESNFVFIGTMWPGPHKKLISSFIMILSKIVDSYKKLVHQNTHLINISIFYLKNVLMWIYNRISLQCNQNLLYDKLNNYRFVFAINYELDMN